MRKKFLNRKFLVSLICLLFVAFFVLWTIKGYFDLTRNLKTRSANAFDIIDQRIASLFLEIDSFSGNAANDILFLSKLSCFQDAINYQKSESAYHGIKNIEKDFLEFLKQSSAYYQLRYIDKNGNEIIRVDFDGKDYKVIPNSKLQDKSLRYYFDQAMNLDEGEAYISPLDLNIENGEIENRGTESDPIYVPVVRYAASVFDGKGNKRGIIITNLYADYFLEDIRRFQRNEEAVFLVNSEGYYLAHPDREKEFAFMFSKNDNFYNDYPVMPREILSDFNKRRIETDDLIFFFRRIYPTVGSFEVYKGSEKIFGKNSESNYFWVLVSVSEKDEINKVLESFKESYLFFLLFSAIIILMIVILVFIVAFKIPGKG